MGKHLITCYIKENERLSALIGNGYKIKDVLEEQAIDSAEFSNEHYFGDKMSKKIVPSKQKSRFLF